MEKKTIPLCKRKLAMIAEKVRNENKYQSSPLIEGGSELSIKIDHAQYKYLREQYQLHLKQVKSEKKEDVSLKQSIEQEQKAFDEEEPDVGAFLQREKEKYQSQAKAFAKLHTVIERVEGASKKGKGFSKVNLQRWGQLLTDAEERHKNKVYKKLYKGYQHVNKVSMTRDKAQIAALLLSGITLAFSVAAAFIDPSIAKQHLQHEISGIASTVKDYEKPVLVNFVDAVVDLLKGEKNSSFFKFSSTGLKIAAVTVDTISKYGSHFLHVLGSVTPLSIVSVALLNVSAVYFQYQYKQTSRRLKIIEDELITHDNFINHVDPLKQALSEIKPEMTTQQKDKVRDRLYITKLRSENVYLKIMEPLVSRKEKLEMEIKKTEGKLSSSTNTATGALKDPLKEMKTSLGEVVNTIGKFKEHEKVAHELIDVAYEALRTPKEALSSSKETSGAPKETSYAAFSRLKEKYNDISKEILPQVKSDRDALHTIAKTELGIKKMAKKKRDSAIKSVAIGATIMAIGGICLAAGVSTGLLPAAMVISSALLLTYNVGKAIKNHIEAPDNKKFTEQAQNGFKKLLSESADLESKTGITLTEAINISGKGKTLSIEKYIDMQLIKYPEKAAEIVVALERLQKEPSKDNLHRLKEAMLKRKHCWDIFPHSDGENLYKALENKFKMNHRVETTMRTPCIH